MMRKNIGPPLAFTHHISQINPLTMVKQMQVKLSAACTKLPRFAYYFVTYIYPLYLEGITGALHTAGGRGRKE